MLIFYWISPTKANYVQNLTVTGFLFSILPPFLTTKPVTNTINLYVFSCGQRTHEKLPVTQFWQWSVKELAYLTKGPASFKIDEHEVRDE